MTVLTVRHQLVHLHGSDVSGLVFVMRTTPLKAGAVVVSEKKERATFLSIQRNLAQVAQC
jgi:hypothetical protein